MSTIPSRSSQNIKAFIADDSLVVRERLVTIPRAEGRKGGFNRQSRRQRR